MAEKSYAVLTSLKTSVYLLLVLCVFFMLGTIFPQGTEYATYESSGGRFLFLVKTFGLLNIFNGSAFLAVSGLLLINLAFCCYENYFRVKGRRRKGYASLTSPDLVIALNSKPDKAQKIIERMFLSLGFREKPSSEKNVIVYEKGIYYRWLTWLYHAAIAACFAGFVLSGLYVKEGMLTLKKDTPAKIESSMMPETLGWMASPEPPSYTIVLDKFSTEYAEHPNLDMPGDKIARLKVASWQTPLSFDLSKEGIFPKDWFSKLRILENSSTATEKTIEVNDPLKYKGYTFYQVGYEQELELSVEGAKEKITVTAGRSVDIKELGVKLKFGTLRTGNLFQKDGTVRAIEPYVMAKIAPDKNAKNKKPESRKEEAPVKLVVSKASVIAGKKVTLTGYDESSMLSYRYDPGVPLLWFFGSLVFIIMTLRCLGSWQRARFSIRATDTGSVAEINVKCMGLFRSKASLVSNLDYVAKTRISE
ncbi:MAG: cytochrome c biogenesis protein ResB [Deltaproteobacteria bacterium]|nr:cytochrome c biogenesis protein ResB [Deltaproteobacteria bacterium]